MCSSSIVNKIKGDGATSECVCFLKEETMEEDRQDREAF